MKNKLFGLLVLFLALYPATEALAVDLQMNGEYRGEGHQFDATFPDGAQLRLMLLPGNNDRAELIVSGAIARTEPLPSISRTPVSLAWPLELFENLQEAGLYLFRAEDRYLVLAHEHGLVVINSRGDVGQISLPEGTTASEVAGLELANSEAPDGMFLRVRIKDQPNRLMLLNFSPTFGVTPVSDDALSADQIHRLVESQLPSPEQLANRGAAARLVAEAIGSVVAPAAGAPGADAGAPGATTAAGIAASVATDPAPPSNQNAAVPRPASPAIAAEPPTPVPPVRSNGYTFSNGARLIFNDRPGMPGILYSNADGTRLLMASPYPMGPIRPLVGDSSEIPSEYWMPAPTSSIHLLLPNVGPVVMFETGHMARIPLDTSKGLAMQSSTGDPSGEMTWIHMAMELEFEGKKFLLLSIPYAPTFRDEFKPGPNGQPMMRRVADTSAGETFLIESGSELVVRVAYQAIDIQSNRNPIDINDGILSIDGVIRRIDLRNLAGEARYFQPRPLRVPTEHDGKPVENWQEVAERVFPNESDSILQGRARVMPELPRDQAFFERIRTVFRSRTARQAVILGEAGNGVEDALRTFQAAVLRGDFPEIPRTVIFRVLGRQFEEGSSRIGVADQRIAMLRALASQAPTIFVSPRIQQLRGLGTHASNTVDVPMTLLPDMDSGEVRIIGTSSAAEWLEAYGGNPDINRLFQSIERTPLTREEIFLVIDNWTDSHGLPRISPELKTEIHAFAGRFISVGAMLGRTTTLLDRAFARASLANGNHQPLTREHVIAALDGMGVNTNTITLEGARERIERMRAERGNLVIGQEEAWDTLIALEENRAAGTQDPNRPSIRVLLSGPPGVGKTLSAEAFARLTGRRFVKINMAEYANPSSIDEFKRRLSIAVREDAAAVLAFDEGEKAHESVQNLLLSVLNDGVIQLPESLSPTSRERSGLISIDFRQTTIVVTTNAGSSFATRSEQHGTGGRAALPSMGFQVPAATSAPQSAESRFFARVRGRVEGGQQLRDAVQRDGISRPLIDRMQAVVSVHSPTPEHFREVIALQTRNALRELAVQRGLEQIVLTNFHYFTRTLGEAYYHPGISNRIVEQILNEHLRPQITRRFLELGEGEKPTAMELFFNIESGVAEARFLGSCEPEMIASNPWEAL